MTTDLVVFRSKPMRLLQLTSLAFLLLLSACSSKASTDESQELENIKSWAATAQMAGNAWSQGNVPTVYAQQTLSQAQQKLHQETETLAQSATNPTQRRNILEQLRLLESSISQMAQAVNQKDYTAMSQHLKQLSTQEQSLNTLAKTVGGHQ
ncbi:MAG: winged helix-turn-helix transcriptional regulator [Chroococcidiopsidaceae cyanobacterium CP_BM_RX_35]|nr:winged helix-turn-helix transcriptional regulator [Chroococcidiopsidaceae cyanobacterium CP_BM_RX_35]